MDLTKLADLLRELKTAISAGKILLAMSIAGQIVTLVASLLSVFKPTAATIGRDRVEAELGALEHPDAKQIFATCTASGSQVHLAAFGGGFLEKLIIGYVIEAVRKLLDLYKPTATPAVVGNPLAANGVPAVAETVPAETAAPVETAPAPAKPAKAA